ncbi:MAG: thiamine phosphate synthase [Bacteroidota bacterium]
MRRIIDYSLCLVTDSRISLPRTVEEVIELSVRGGVTIVQLREKECSTREFIERARRVKNIVHSHGIPLIINDRVDVALASGADGVHIGQQDMSARDARYLMGPDAIIGFSVETMEQAAEAEKLDVDYLGVSPIFPTPTKTDTATEWGIEGLHALRLQTRNVLVAIGGINLSNAGVVIESGADGLAVVSALCAAADPEGTSRKFRDIIEEKRQKKKGAGDETLSNR